VRRAPGRIVSVRYYPKKRLLVASGKGARKSDGVLELFLPTDTANGGSVGSKGLGQPMFPRAYDRNGVIQIRPKGGSWKLWARIH
jgi:hypothetical protein